MTAFEKEQIFVELRKYHLDEFPKSLSTPKMQDLFVEYKGIEDKIVSMIFGLVNGKTEFVDLSQDLINFNKKAKKTSTSDKAEEADRDLFLSKSAHLSLILNIAAAGTFKLRPVRKPKIIRSTNPREVVEN